MQMRKRTWDGMGLRLRTDNAAVRGRGGRPWSGRAGDEEARVCRLDGEASSVLLTGRTGALIAVGFASVLRGRGGDVISRAAGSGVLDEGALAAKARLSEDIERGKVVPQGIADPDPQRPGP